jgi:hypothetical protein
MMVVAGDLPRFFGKKYCVRRMSRRTPGEIKVEP